MLPDGRRFGAHLPLGGGMVKAVTRAVEIGADCLQVFSDNPSAWHRRAAPPRELPAFRARLAEHGIGPIAIHGSYLVNLAGPDPEPRRGSIALLAHELRDAPTYRARFVNVHIGSHRDTGVTAGIERVADGIALAFAEVDDGPDAAMLVLENSAGSGWGIGTDVPQLAAIAEAIDRRGVPRRRVGFCLDTAHAWGAGMDFASPAAIDDVLAAFDERIGLDRLVMVHLNDSKAELGSRHDRHEHIGAGLIGPTGLGHLVRHPSLAGVAFYLETPGMDEGYDAVNMTRVRALVDGRPLEALPAEAFALGSGARARTAPA